MPGREVDVCDGAWKCGLTGNRGRKVRQELGALRGRGGGMRKGSTWAQETCVSQKASAPGTEMEGDREKSTVGPALTLRAPGRS